ncbi:transmembrane BAX inhibitor motif containing [Echinococcus multilocularis]|uniref:Transmembrane BAX inhibitor motif containing n=1 Tax=Echinococcus multilocularis TaxID=6211 RepID=A0A068Y0R6_ECHMU|nr:transmembrane BAX inhibitor motif containing [Echinococcus multilocularis]
MSSLSLGRKLENDFSYNNCVKDADVYIRMEFLRKLYSVLCAQLVLTCTTGAVLLTFKEQLSPFLAENSFILFLLIIASLVLLIAMFYKRYDTPMNFILLFSFTLVESFFVGLVVVRFDLAIVLQAFLITAALTIGLTLYTLQTKRDFSSWAACLGTLLMALFIGGVSNAFFASPAIHLALSIGGAFLFACLLIFDTQIIMERFSAEEYIAASITLYLDILNLFLYALRVLQTANNS